MFHGFLSKLPKCKANESSFLIKVAKESRATIAKETFPLFAQVGKRGAFFRKFSNPNLYISQEDPRRMVRATTVLCSRPCNCNKIRQRGCCNAGGRSFNEGSRVRGELSTFKPLFRWRRVLGRVRRQILRVITRANIEGTKSSSDGPLFLKELSSHPKYHRSTSSKIYIHL